MLLGNFFTHFASDTTQVAKMVNTMASDVFLSDRKTKTDETRLLMRLCAHTHGIASESDAAGPLSTQNTSKIL